jgi:hypothetical protein
MPTQDIFDYVIFVLPHPNPLREQYCLSVQIPCAEMGQIEVDLKLNVFYLKNRRFSEAPLGQGLDFDRCL